MEIAKSAESLIVRKGYDPAWLDQALAIYNRTEMKRGNRDQVHQAFYNLLDILNIKAGNLEKAIARERPILFLFRPKTNIKMFHITAVELD